MCLIGIVDEGLPPSTSYWGYWIPTQHAQRVIHLWGCPEIGQSHALGDEVHVETPSVGRISLFVRLNTRVISLNFPGACICVLCNPRGHILCLHTKFFQPKHLHVCSRTKGK